VRASGGDGITLQADGALLKRALWNLVENAGKYGAPPIEISAARAGDAVELRVRDAGPGIAAAERDRVFEPFYRGDKARTPGNGFGLGLTLARRVAEAHGGSIDVDGAVFTMRIPANAGAA
jgi:signal transduction histidine kinase